MKDENNNNYFCLNQNSINKIEDNDRYEMGAINNPMRKPKSLFDNYFRMVYKNWTLILTFVLIIYFYYVYMFVNI
jgi:hypothetical protein